MSWVVQHAAALESYSLIGALAVGALWESFRVRRPLRYSTAHRWTTNITLAALGGLLASLLVPVTSLAAATMSADHGSGLLNWLGTPAPVALVASVLLLDVASYGQHWILHRVAFFWRFHQIHHTDLDVDCGTAVRHHPGEALLAAGVAVVLVLTLGLSPAGVVVYATLAGILAAFNHANVPIAESVERLLRKVVVTPDMHRVHHSMSLRESNSNFTVVFPWWDHLFGTYTPGPELGQERMIVGVQEYPEPRDVGMLRVLLMPFTRARPVTLGPSPQS